MVIVAWEHLARVRSLAFSAHSALDLPSGWRGRGQGRVEVEQPDHTTLIFRESGAWSDGDRPRLNFHNVFRWTLDALGGRLRLEHLRFGAAHPVYLFDLVPAVDGGLESAEPHACREDRYAARMEFDGGEVRLSWRITGPAKASEVNYVYRQADGRIP